MSKQFNQISLSDKLYIFTEDNPFPEESTITRLEQNTLEITLVVRTEKTSYLVPCEPLKTSSFGVFNNIPTFICTTRSEAVRWCMGIIQEKKEKAPSEDKRLTQLENLLREDL